jgi:hypothetical protein
VRAIRRNPAYAGLRFFAVTGGAPDQFDLGSGPAGIDRWYRKPLDPASLLNELKQELGAPPAPCNSAPYNLPISRGSRAGCTACGFPGSSSRLTRVFGLYAARHQAAVMFRLLNGRARTTGTPPGGIPP